MNSRINISNSEKTLDTNRLLLGIETLIEKAGRDIAVYLNTEISCLYWSIGNYIVSEMQYETYSQQGRQILATLSQTLTERFGKGYTYSGLNRMIKVAEAYTEEMFATLSRTLSWSHYKQWFIEKLNKSIAIAQQNINSR